jgi:1,2-phenylacetyl-CoA epoxidase PaaB subunit
MTTTWEVFARKAYDEPLHHVGALHEDDEIREAIKP